MGKRTFCMGTNMAAIERQEAARQLILQGLLDDPRAEQLNVDEKGLANARRFSRLHDDTPTLKHGVAAPAIVRGERYQLTDEHRNAHGERVLEGYRSVGGGRMQKILIHEAQATEHSTIVTRTRAR